MSQDDGSDVIAGGDVLGGCAVELGCDGAVEGGSCAYEGDSSRRGSCGQQGQAEEDQARHPLLELLVVYLVDDAGRLAH